MYHLVFFSSMIITFFSGKSWNLLDLFQIQVCSNEGPCPFPRGDNYEIAKNTLTKLKNLLLQNHWANFNQTWPKASLGEGDSSLFK